MMNTKRVHDRSDDRMSRIIEESKNRHEQRKGSLMSRSYVDTKSGQTGSFVSRNDSVDTTEKAINYRLQNSSVEKYSY